MLGPNYQPQNHYFWFKVNDSSLIVIGLITVFVCVDNLEDTFFPFERLYDVIVIVL